MAASSNRQPRQGSTRDELLALLTDLERAKLGDGGPGAPALPFREFLESTSYCGLTLSPLMAAVADAADGRRVDLDDAACAKHFGCAAAALPAQRPRTICVRAGGRAGKSSRLLAPKALHAAITVPLPTLNPGEVATALLVAPDMKLARQTLSFVKGYVDESPVLRSMRVRGVADSVELQRPDGKRVRVEILAATRGGRAVRARTLVFAGMDEACFFYPEGGGAVNDSEIYRAVAQRVVPGGQEWIVSTPWLANTGLLEGMISREWGRHQRALCVTGGTRALNPTWDPDGEVERGLRAQDEAAARREIDGEPLAGSAVSFFDPKSIDDAIDKTLVLPRTPKPLDEVTCGADFGFQSDACGLCVVHRNHDGYIVADLLERIPGAEPLKPSAVVGEFADRMLAHAGLQHLVADGHYRQTIAEHLNDKGLSLRDAPAGSKGVSDVYIKARGLFREGKVRIPDHARLLKQLRAIEWRPNPGGSVSIVKPRETRRVDSATGDMSGGHCDLADAVVLALWEACGLAVPEPAPEVGSAEYYKQEEQRIWQHAEEQLEAKKNQDWWAA